MGKDNVFTEIVMDTKRIFESEIESIILSKSNDETDTATLYFFSGLIVQMKMVEGFLRLKFESKKNIPYTERMTNERKYFEEIINRALPYNGLNNN